MTELSFLVDILLNHPLKKATKELIAERIKMLSQSPMPIVPANVTSPMSVWPMQPPTGVPSAIATAIDAPVPVSQIAQTPAAAEALAARAAMINAKLSNPLKTDGGIFKPMPKPKA